MNVWCKPANATYLATEVVMTLECLISACVNFQLFTMNAI